MNSRAVELKMPHSPLNQCTEIYIHLKQSVAYIYIYIYIYIYVTGTKTGSETKRRPFILSV